MSNPSPGPYSVMPGFAKLDSCAVLDVNGEPIGVALVVGNDRALRAANARLFAASWDLLEAAKAVMASEDELTFPGIEDESKVYVAFQQLEEAIAKATHS